MSAGQVSAADPEWFLQFGLDRDPFAEGGVHGLFYPGGARQETVEQLAHLARYSDCVLLVTGVAGAGKSVTRRHFVAQAAADTRCCVIEAALLDGPEQWLRRVLAGLGIRPVSPPDLGPDLQLLTDFCLGRSASGTRTWLVVDDAQDLHEGVVGVLGRVLEATGRSLRLAFFAEPRWRETLQAALPGGVALHTLELQPFDPGETHAYLHYRLNTAGLDGEPPFNAQEYERIHRESGGIPGRINAVAREVLQTAATEVERPLNALPLWHFGVIAATLVALILLYVWGSIDQDSPRAAPPHPLAQEAASGPAGAVPEIQIAPEETARETDGAQAAAVEPDAPAAVEPDELPEAVPEIATAAGPEDDAGPIDVPGEPAAEVPRDAANPPVVEAPPATSPATAATSAPAEYVYGPAGRSGGAPSVDERYLLGLDPGHYVLQIMGSDDGARVRAFAARSGAGTRVYRKLNNGREWYALVQGEYPSRAAAEAALRQLPPRLRDSRPWVRRLDAVQKEIRAARAM